MTTQNSAMGDKEREQIIEGVYRWAIDAVNQAIEESEDGLKQPFLVTGKAPLLAPSEAVEKLKSRDQQIALAAQEAKLQGELSALNYSNDAFHDLAAPDLEKWFLNERDRLLEELAEVKQQQNKEK